jgi:hypothetical protein
MQTNLVTPPPHAPPPAVPAPAIVTEPSVPAAELTVQQHKVASDSTGSNSGPRPPEQQAVILWRGIIPALMTATVGVEDHVRASGCRVLLDRLAANSGDGTDAVEVMLIEQLALAHFRAAQLQAQAAEAKSLEAARVYNAAAGRMLAEFRKITLTLQTYREKALALARAEREAVRSTTPPPQAADNKDTQGKRGRHEKKIGQQSR